MKFWQTVRYAIATRHRDYYKVRGQLARIWHYDIKIVQGKGIMPRLEDMDFDFAEFDLS